MAGIQGGRKRQADTAGSHRTGDIITTHLSRHEKMYEIPTVVISSLAVPSSNLCIAAPT